MNNEQQLQDDINRGVKARSVLDNELYQEAFTALRAELYNGFTQTKFKDSDERDEIWRKQQAVDFVERYLNEVMEKGETSRTFLERLRGKTRRVVGL